MSGTHRSSHGGLPTCSAHGRRSDVLSLPLFLECDATCVGCTGKGPGSCKECIPGYSREGGQCTGQCTALRGRGRGGAQTPVLPAGQGVQALSCGPQGYTVLVTLWPGALLQPPTQAPVATETPWKGAVGRHPLRERPQAQLHTRPCRPCCPCPPTARPRAALDPAPSPPQFPCSLCGSEPGEHVPMMGQAATQRSPSCRRGRVRGRGECVHAPQRELLQHSWELRVRVSRWLRRDGGRMCAHADPGHR